MVDITVPLYCSESQTTMLQYDLIEVYGGVWGVVNFILIWVMLHTFQSAARWLKRKQTDTQTMIKSLVKFVLCNYHWGFVLHAKSHCKTQIPIEKWLWWLELAACLPVFPQHTTKKKKNTVGSIQEPEVGNRNRANHGAQHNSQLHRHNRCIPFIVVTLQSERLPVRCLDLFWLLNTSNMRKGQSSQEEVLWEREREIERERVRESKSERN